jgi:predicted Zn-dependent protease with MMP-like domain
MTKLIAIIATALLAASACNSGHGIDADTTYVVRDSALVDVVADCLAQYQSAVPYALSVQDGGKARGSFVAVGIADRIEHGRDALEPAGAVRYDGRIILVHEDTLAGDFNFLRLTVCHEIGHTLGLTHDDACEPGSLMDPASTDADVSACELSRLRDLYR